MRHNNYLVHIFYLSLFFIVNTCVLLAQWQQSGLKDYYLTSILKADSILLVGSHNRVFISNNQGKTWHEKTNGLEGKASVLDMIRVNQTIIATAHGIIKSDDVGESWRTIYSDSSLFLFGYLIDIDSTIFFTGGQDGNRIFKSSDGGLTWTEITPNINKNFITALVKYNDRVVFCIDRDPNIWFSKGGVYISKDMGNNWSYFSQEEIGGDGRYPEMTVQNGILFVASNVGLIKSTDWGLSWEICLPKGGLPALHTYKDLLLAGSISGMIYGSIDNGETWRRVDEGFYGSPSFADYFETDEEYIYMITRSDGIWRRNIREIYSSLHVIDKPKAEYSILLSCYPNPLSNTTNVQYKTSERSKVIINLYDVFGREVRTLVDEVKDAGNYNVTLSSDGLQNGIYFYQLTTGDTRITKKCIVMK